LKTFHDLLDELKRGDAPTEMIEAFVAVRDTLVYARDMAKAELGENVSPELCVKLCEMVLQQEARIKTES
jgi:hypothetical protein